MVGYGWDGMWMLVAMEEGAVGARFDGRYNANSVIDKSGPISNV